MKSAVEEAHRRIASHISRTECRPVSSLSDSIRGDFHLKLENLQDTGSFKLRGVLNKILSLSEEELQKLLVAASTGNHGAAFARALEIFGLQGRLFMPLNTAAVKVENLRSTGIPFELVGKECLEAEAAAMEFAEAGGHVWISPYNDRAVIHGQGTIAVELIDQLGTIDAVLVPVGGGGLISGVAGYLKSVDPSIRVFGCQPVKSCVMYESIRSGEILDIESLPTVSDGTAGGIEKGSITFDLCNRYVDDFILLEESEIIDAVSLLYERHGLAVEGAAALPVAGVLKHAEQFVDRRTALIISGGRIDDAALTAILEKAGDGSRVGKTS